MSEWAGRSRLCWGGWSGFWGHFILSFVGWAMVRVCLLSLGLGLSIVLLGAGGAFGEQKGAVGGTVQVVDEWKAEADQLFTKGLQQYKTSQYDAATQTWNQALILYRAVRDRSSEAAVLMNLGVVYNKLSHYKQAIDYYEQALPIYQEIEERSGEAKVMMNLGIVYDSLSQYEQAIDYYEKARPIFQKLNDRNNEATLLMNQGVSYANLSQYEKAIRHYEYAQLIFQESKNRHGEAGIIINLGVIFQELSQDEKAIRHYEKAKLIFQEFKDHHGEASVIMNLGVIYEKLSQYEKAIRHYEKAKIISQRLKDRHGEASAIANLGSVYVSLGQHEKAINYYEQARYIFQELNSQNDYAKAIMGLGGAYASLGQYEKAINYLEQSFLFHKQVQNHLGQGKNFNNFGFLFVKKDQPDLAIAFYKQSVNIYESIRNNLRSLSRETQESYTSSISKTYRTLADLLLTQGRTREAQEILELLKVQENRGYDRASQSQQPTVQLTLHPLEQQALQTFETAIARKQPLTLQDYEKLNQTLTQNRDRLIQDGNAKESTIGNPKNLITNPNTILIQNLVVNNKIWVIWTSQSGQTKAIATPVPQTDLDQTVQQFRKQLSSPTSNLASLQATSRKLHNWLIPPTLQTELTQQPKQHLIFSLDHVTRYIPVATLHDGQTYLIQRYQLSNIITTKTDTTDLLLAPAQTPVLALGTAQEFPNFSELKFVPIELQNISQDGNPQGLYPGQKYLNTGFNRDVLKTLDRYRIVHIATHGQFNPTNILNSFLLLGNGDRLPISEIDQLTNLTNTHLVVLSACETGLGEVKSDGTEISGMSGYFLYRGAKSVMASLWSVSDPSTALSMRQFYSGLAQGKTKAEALQQVQRDFIQGKLTSVDADELRGASMGDEAILIRPNYEHPFYWAPFILVGNSL